MSFRRQPVVLLAIVVVDFQEAPSSVMAVSSRRPSSRTIQFATDRVSVVFTLVGAAGGATVSAYVTGSSLFFVSVVGLRRAGTIIFSACSAAVMCSAIMNRRLGRWERTTRDDDDGRLGLLFRFVERYASTDPGRVLLHRAFAAPLMIVALAFGISLPNIINATMQSLPTSRAPSAPRRESIQMICGSGAKQSGCSLL